MSSLVESTIYVVWCRDLGVQSKPGADSAEEPSRCSLELEHCIPKPFFWQRWGTHQYDGGLSCSVCCFGSGYCRVGHMMVS